MVYVEVQQLIVMVTNISYIKTYVVGYSSRKMFNERILLKNKGSLKKSGFVAVAAVVVVRIVVAVEGVAAGFFFLSLFFLFVSLALGVTAAAIDFFISCHCSSLNDSCFFWGR